MEIFYKIFRKKQDKESLERQRKITSVTRRNGSSEATFLRSKNIEANDFVNVKDIKNSVLHTKDGFLFVYLKVEPISLELLSKEERKRKIRTFSSEFSAERKSYKFISISRPIDISGLLAWFKSLLAEATEQRRKTLLNEEIKELNAYALGGEVIERQFFCIIWEQEKSGTEKEILQRASDIEARFSRCEINATLCDKPTIVRLLNLFANPTYAHLEDDDIEAAVPFLYEERSDFN